MVYRTQVARFAALVGLSALSIAPALAAQKAKPAKALPKVNTAPKKVEAPLTEEQKVRHALDRLAFGPRPGDVERVKSLGLSTWIEQQLHPEHISDEDVEAEIAPLTTLAMAPDALTAAYRKGMQAQRQLAREKAQATDASAAPMDEDQAARRARMQARLLAQRVVGELQMAKVARAVASNRQLLEVMTDFWTNHFNIDVRKGPARALKTVDDREVIRKHALGHFRDLLGASAKSPAMLVYLDNFRSSAPPKNARPAARQRNGLNENYARELMELHTLGVDGGYTQKDVIEVARCFTGWSIDPRTGTFAFYPRRHDDGAKTVLGHAIPAGGGIEDGETVLDVLAASPATARHISYQLCQRFVADAPPAALVDRAAKKYLATGGDIREVVRLIITSPEFNSPIAYRQKIKSPFEFAVSAVRALDGHIVIPGGGPYALASFTGGGGRRGGRRLIQQVANLGEPLFQYQQPTGYPEDSRSWVSAGALIARMNFAIDLAHGRIADVQLPETLGTMRAERPEQMLPSLAGKLLNGDLSAATRASLLKQVHAQSDGETVKRDPALIAALLLGSPEFQRR